MTFEEVSFKNSQGNQEMTETTWPGSNQEPLEQELSLPPAFEVQG